jgi:hypothetical protein
MNAKLLGLIACMSLLGASPARATVYQLDVPPGLFSSSTITTDGETAAPLSASDITSWQINQIADTVHFMSGMNPSNSTLSLVPGALTETATGLFFDFSDAAASKLEFSSTAIPGNSLQYCDATSPCLNQNDASDFSLIEYVFVAPGCCSTSAGTAETGIAQIAAATVTSGAIPTPATVPLFATGIGVIGLLRWRRKQSR